MTKVTINPGPCGFVTAVECVSEDGMDAKVAVKSGCQSIRDMMEALGDTFDSYEICLKHPGEGEFYEYAKEHFPVHAACPVLIGIVKCIEAECKLALPQNVSIEFE